MDLMMKIGSALLLLIMIVMLLPRAMDMMRNSPEAQKGDWSAIALPLATVVAFVLLLMWLV